MQADLQAHQTATAVQGPVDDAPAVAATHPAKQTGRSIVPGPPAASALGKLIKAINTIIGTANKEIVLAVFEIIPELIKPEKKFGCMLF